MIKARGTDSEGKTVYIFGLSAGNMDLLLKGRPIEVHLEQLGGQGRVIIVGGLTEEAILDDMKRQGVSTPAPIG